jgi:Domain of unknown function (DUF4082)/Bacterial Ig-like domain
MKKLPAAFSVHAVLLFLLAAGAVGHGQSAPIATVALTQGWATFGEVVPQGLAPDALQVGSLPTQTDVKTRWADGSIRFAIVTASVPAAGSYAVSAAPASAGSFAPQLPSAAVTLTIGGIAYTATLPSVPATDAWLNGPLVREGRTAVAPATSSGAAHPFLRVNFDTRVYGDGKARVDVSVENVLDKAGATTVTYDATITVGGQIVFTKTAVQHYYLTRWRKTFEVGPMPLASITPDLAPFNVARALPPYLSQVTNVVSTPTGASYDILNSGAVLANMPAHGGRPELAPYPDWTARYLVHRNATQRSFVLANGDLSGSWPVHVREAETSTTSGVGTERFISLDQRPRIWYDSRAQGDLLDYVKGSPMPIREYGSLTPGPGQSPLIPDNAHQPSIAYVPYLLTGDRYYAEEMAFWANYSMLRTYPQDGVRGANGILAYNEVRGYGWALRNIVDAAAYYPDASPVRAYLAQKVAANLQWLDTYANAQGPSNPFKIMWLNKRPEGAQYISMWEQNYLAHAIDRANKQGFGGGLAHRDAIARFQLRMFTSDPDYPRAQASPYIVAVGTPGSPFAYFTTMAQIWAGTQGQERPFAGFYGPETRMTLMMGAEGGWTGAQGAYDYLWPFIGTGSPSDLAQRAGWAVDFYPGPGAPPPPPPPPPALAISNVSSTNVTTTSATINWTTNAAANSRVDYGTTTAYGSVASDPTMVTSHSASLTGLTASTTYHYKITSQANTGETAATGDFTVTTANAPDTTAPTVTAVTPAAGATGVATTTTVTATFSEAMSASTVTAATFVLRDAAGAGVAAAVSYNSSTRVATLTPSAALTNSQTYTATVVADSAGVKDVAGNPLAANRVWSWTTAASAPPPPSGSVTIWSATTTPAAIATNDPSAVELGVKFRSDVAGTVTGVRFYKGTTTTGTHTGTLWSSTGTRLATATFTNETKSGWQQVSFSTPVAITANTTYVVSYHTNVGNYAYTSAYFTSKGADNAPLHAPASGAVGGNGVYRYASSSVFPTSTFNGNNYWVDVVFVPR